MKKQGKSLNNSQIKPEKSERKDNNNKQEKERGIVYDMANK